MPEADPHVATFFVRYQEVLPFTTDEPHVLAPPLAGRLHGFHGTVLHGNPDGTAGTVVSAALADTLFTSFRFHLIEQAEHPAETELLRLGQIIYKHYSSFPSTDNPEPATAEERLHQTFGHYVVEITAPLIERHADGDWYPSPVTNDAVHAAFERALEVLFLLIRACRACHQESQRLYAPARERLGSVMLLSTRPHDSLDSWTPPAAVTLAMAMPLELISIPPLDDTVRSKMRDYFNAETFGHAGAAIMELQLDARAALTRGGDTRAAVLLSHTASEVLLDETLMLMQWEEGCTPEEAATVFKKPLIERVRSQYHDRLGGTWNPSAQGATGQWREDLVLLRHRVAHSGYAPRRDEAERALAAQQALRRFVLDRLAARCRKYPRTAGILITEAGFRRRGAWTRAAREAAAGSHLEATLPFLNWRDVLTDRRMQ